MASLSPWPTDAVELAAATARLKAAVDPNLTDSVAEHLGAVASALVEQYAPAAPQVLREEGVLRVAGRLHESPPASVRSEAVGDIRTSYAPSLTGALLHSGVKSLLYPHRTKRAGVAK